MNNNVRSWSNNHRNSRLARLGKSFTVLLVMACGAGAPLEAQTVTTVIASNLYEPHSVATDGVNAYVTDAVNNRIVKYALSTSNLTTLAGFPGLNPGYADGTGFSALFNQPLGIVFARGGLVVVDSGNQVIRFVTTNGATSLIAGTPTNVINGVGGFNTNGLGGYANGIGTDAQFAFPTAITADAAGNLYVADTGNRAIRKIDATPTNVVTTITTNFNSPEAVALDTNGNLWVADTGRNSICVISNVAAANVVYTIANTGFESGSRDSLNATNATFNFPSGLLWSTNMNSLLISDTHNDTIRNLYQSNGLWSVQTIAGSAGVAGQADGAPLSATFDAPVGLALDVYDGNNFYYVVDRAGVSNGTLRALQPSLLPQVAKGPPTVTITAPTNNAVVIMPANILITLTATDTNLNGTITNIQVLTNNVVWSSNSTALSYNLSNPTTNVTYILVAIATDNSGISATSAPVSIKVISAQTPLIEITSPGTGSEYTQPSSNATIGLSVPITTESSDPNTAYNALAGLGPVTYYANGKSIPTVPAPGIGPDSVYWNNPGVGQYSLTAVVSDTPYGLSATSAPVNINVVGVQQPIVSIVSPAAGTFFAPTNITINVNAIDPNTNGLNATGQISGVTLYNGTNQVPPSQYTYEGKTQPDIYTFILNDPALGNYSLTAVATDTVFQVSGTSAPVNITVTLPAPPPPVFNPSSGYFPFCQTIAITETAPSQPIQIFYTTDGKPPTTNSLPVSNLASNNGVWTGSIQWCDATHDLSQLQMIAFNGVVASTAATGQASPTNQIGFVRGVTNGGGATVILPIVVDLRSNGVLASLQFRAEVVPSGGNPPAMTSLALLPLSTNDFVPFIGPGAAGTTVTFETVSYPAGVNGNGQGLLISAAGGNSGFSVNGFGVVGLLAAQIPTNATAGQTYQLNVLFPSGTSDAQQTEVNMVPMTNQFITVETIQYFEGDSSPGSGYNAGEFGNGILNAADVNNALYASVGIRVPYAFSDAYNAMDTYPETATELGDGFITYLDWQHILYRSEGLETNNWVRFWTNGARAHLGIAWSPSSNAVSIGVTPQAISEKSSGGKGPVPKDVSELPGLVWLRQAAISAGTLANLASGSSASMPVYAKVQPGYNLSGLQFRATLVANGGAPQPGAVEFSAAPGIPSPASQLPGLGPNDIICAWNLGAFANPLEGNNLLGSITFQVPAGAQPGQSYSLHFSGVDGAPDLNTLYQLESVPATAWVMSAALQPPQITSDEWRTNFFGSYTNALAADNADPDGDGSLNWQEYVAGTNPTNALSRLQFSSIHLGASPAGSATLSWLTAPGKTYLLESIPALGGANWSVINTSVGDGNVFQFTPPVGGKASFYRICVQP
jgi:sugar lactone lactonase YvrE